MNASVCDKGEIEDGEVAGKLEDRTKRKGGTSWSGVGERPKKQFKTTINVSKNFVTCTCILTIPTWVKQTLPMALFRELLVRCALFTICIELFILLIPFV